MAAGSYTKKREARKLMQCLGRQFQARIRGETEHARGVALVVQTWPQQLRHLQGESPPSSDHLLYGGARCYTGPGKVANEKDSARDVSAFVAVYLYMGASFPARLQPRSVEKGGRPVQTRRDLLFFGHSLCAHGALLVSAHAPQLFRGLVVLDPPVVPAGKILDAFAKISSYVFVLGLNETKAKDVLVQFQSMP